MAEEGGIDPAALAGATLAGALTIFAPEGPYKWPSAIIGLTLVAIITAYDVEPARKLRQSIAYGAVFGLLAMLVVGAWFERLFAREGLGENESAIPTWAIFSVWVGVLIVVTLIDQIRVCRVKKRSEEKQQ